MEKTEISVKHYDREFTLKFPGDICINELINEFEDIARFMGFLSSSVDRAIIDKAYELVDGKCICTEID